MSAQSHIITPEEELVKDEYIKLFKCAMDTLYPYVFSRKETDGSEVFYLIKLNSSDLYSLFENYFDDKTINLYIMRALKDIDGLITYSSGNIHLNQDVILDYITCKLQNKKCITVENLVVENYTNERRCAVCDLKPFQFNVRIFKNMACNILEKCLNEDNIRGRGLTYLKTAQKTYGFHVDKFKDLFAKHINVDYGLSYIVNARDLQDTYRYFTDEIVSQYMFDFEFPKHFLSEYDFPVDWALFADFNKMLKSDYKNKLSETYSWFINGRKTIVKNGKEITVNHRKEFFNSYPLIAVTFHYRCEYKQAIGDIVDENKDVFNKLLAFFVNKFPRIERKDIKDALKLLNGRVFKAKGELIDIEKFIMFISCLPERTRREIIEEGEDSGLNSVLLEIFHASDYCSSHSSFEVNMVANDKKAFLRNTFHKTHIRNFLSEILLEHHSNFKRKIYDFFNDVAPLFVNRVLLPMIAYNMKDSNEEQHNNILTPYMFNYLKHAFFIHRCKFSLIDILRLNKAVHNDMVLFTESGKDYSNRRILESGEIEALEGNQFPYFSHIRSDPYRQKLGLSYNIDWMPLIDRTYDSVDGVYHIVSLLSQDDLLQESNIMGHCVGRFSYDERCYRGRSRIFTVVDDKNIRRASVELRLENNKIYIEQVRGYENDMVDREIHKAVANMVNDMNAGRIKIDWQHINDETPTGKVYFAGKRKASSGERKKTLKEACGYDYSNLTSIRAAGEPWRAFLPKKLNSLNPDAFSSILGGSENNEEN